MSSQTETWGKTYVYSDGTISSKPIETKDLIFYCSITENDGYKFMRRGPEAKMFVRIDKKANKSKLVKIIQKSELDKTIKESVKKLYKEGNLEPGTYEID